MGQIKSFRDLRVWQAGMELVELVYRLSRGFPHYEVFGLAGQLRRSAASIPSNIAEGHASEHSKEFLRYLSMAQTSLAEVETHLEIAGRLGYTSTGEVEGALQACEHLSKQIYALRKALHSRVSSANRSQLQVRSTK